MVETIAPVVHGDKRNEYKLTVALHTLAASIGAGLTGAILGGLGALAGAPWGAMGFLVLAAIALIYALREAFGLPIPLPQRRGQVPDWWRTFFSTRVAAVFYGLGLGAGYLTYLSFGTLAAVGVAAFSFGNPLLGAALLAPFGAARGLSVLVARKTRDEDEVAAVCERLEREVAGGGLRKANAAVLLLMAAVAAGAAASIGI